MLTKPSQSEPFGIYVHWPFCAAKCPYCDFNSHVRSHIDENAWVSGICCELEHVRTRQPESVDEVQSIFFGGGTPSLMDGRSVADILDKISGLWRVSDQVEITLESNPASADAGRFRDYRAAGVNRLSLGVQALNDSDLKALGRLHTAAEAEQALKLALEIFERVSIDLIYARPGQTPIAWRGELAKALSFGTEHLSLYQLTIEPGTPFAALAGKGTLQIPGEGPATAMYELTQELTEAAGLRAYEISNHARPGAECRHNLLYWRYGQYVGVGPGAHGRLSLSGSRVATLTERLPERWLDLVNRQGHGFSEWKTLSNEDAAREHLLMSLRLREGLDLGTHQASWGILLDDLRIRELEALGLICVAHDRLQVTPRGCLLLNSVIAALA